MKPAIKLGIGPANIAKKVNKNRVPPNIIEKLVLSIYGLEIEPITSER